MEDIIVHANVLFDDRAGAIPSQKSSQTLNPPLVEATLVVKENSNSSRGIVYGPSFAQPSSPLPQATKTTSDSSPTQDFAPRLPPRPGNSIHPSHRAANQSRVTDSETDDETPPALPPRQARSEVQTMHTSEGSVSEPQTSPVSERHEDSSTGTEVTMPSAGPSSPTSVRSHQASQTDAPQSNDAAETDVEQRTRHFPETSGSS